MVDQRALQLLDDPAGVGVRERLGVRVGPLPRPGEALGYTSEASRTFVHLPDRVIEGTSSTDVDYLLRDEPGGGTRIAMDIVIGFGGVVAKWMALLLGRTENVWSGHQRIELENLARRIDAAA